jgi:hypothetical protein
VNLTPTSVLTNKLERCDAEGDGKKYTKTVTNSKTGRKKRVRYGAKGYTIAPGTDKGDRYCARSFGDMKSHGKDCSGPDRNTPLCLSRAKWKCSGKTSRREDGPSTEYYRTHPEARRKKVAKQAAINRRPEERERRTKLNRERRKRDIAGKGGPDISHTEAGKTVLEDPSTNRARNGHGKQPRLKRDSISAPLTPKAVLAAPRTDTPERGKGKPCGESHIPKTHKCTKGEGKSKAPEQTTKSDKQLKLWAAAGLSATAVAGISYILYKDPVIRKDLSFRLKEDPTFDKSKRFQIRNSIDSYVRGSYSLNTNLRSGEALPSNLTLLRDGLDKWMSRTKPQQGIYYRGFDADGREAKIWSGLRVGDSYTDKGYTSLSSSRKIGEEFSGLTDRRDGFLLVARGGAFPIPYGITGSGRFSVAKGYEDERESLASRNTTYKVTKIKKVKARQAFSPTTNQTRRSPRGVTLNELTVIYVDILNNPPKPRRPRRTTSLRPRRPG